MSPKLQVKLLRVLQEREFERVGESRTIRVDVRVIAATNTSLEDLVERGEFREDLYYRLNVVPILLPPLRDRHEDIPTLAKFFLRRYADANKLTLPDLSPEVLTALRVHDWPGNVRELENAIERLVVLSDEGELRPELLKVDRPRVSLRGTKGGTGGPPTDAAGLMKQLVRAGVQTPLPAGVKLHRFLVGGLERELIEHMVRLCDGVQLKAAERLGINRNTLHKKTEEYKDADASAEADAGAEDAAAPSE